LTDAFRPCGRLVLENLPFPARCVRYSDVRALPPAAVPRTHVANQNAGKPRLGSRLAHADGLIVKPSTLAVGPPVNPILMDERAESTREGRICFPMRQ
jgi:hypothetical protein